MIQCSTCGQTVAPSVVKVWLNRVVCQKCFDLLTIALDGGDDEPGDSLGSREASNPISIPPANQNGNPQTHRKLPSSLEEANDAATGMEGSGSASRVTHETESSSSTPSVETRIPRPVAIQEHDPQSQEKQQKETDEPPGKANSQRTTKENGGAKIGGLLYLLGLYVVSGPVIGIMWLGADVVFATDLSSFKGALFLYWARLLSDIAMEAAMVYLVFLFFRRDRRFPARFTWVALLGFILSLINCFFSAALIPDASAMTADIPFEEVAGALFPLLTWSPYLYNSRRSSATFVR